MNSLKALLHSDGASLGNPGPSGIGVVIRSGGRTYELSEHIGIATNNVAEYKALIRGLERAKALGAEELEICLDSELIVRQVNGLYKVRDEKLKPLYSQALRLLSAFGGFVIRHVPREENLRADKLAKKGAGA